MTNAPDPIPNAHLLTEIAILKARMDAIEAKMTRSDASVYVPKPPFTATNPNMPFMSYSTCSAADLMHPRYREILRLLALHDSPYVWNRKLWEWVFIVHNLLEHGAVKAGSRGLVFGVGNERLPAALAGMGAKIVATDAPTDIGEANGWADGVQHMNSLAQIRYPELVADDVFNANVSYLPCDMNNIQPELKGFDFNWSSCCFEHLGSLEAGMQFMINAVEKTLRPGGIAVHTTEFNLSSNEDTVAEGGTVIYRRQDMEMLVQRLTDRGHKVLRPFIVAPDSHYWDFHIDLPPYGSRPHLKLQLGKYVATSVGIVVQKGM
jgi:hypothetical protein